MKIYKQNEQFFMEDNDNVIALVPNEDYYLKLPANSVNRVWVSCTKIDKAPDQCVDYGDNVKVARTIVNTQSRKPLEDYLDDNDKAIFLSLIEKAKKARDEANKKTPMTELEKAQRAVEKWMAKVEALKNA